MSKPWERPWSTEEIIANSDSWNLAGDVALLHNLKAFADNLITKTNEINNELQNLTDTLDQTSLRLDIAQNEFQGLKNTQFIESRVYEDDETLPVEEEKKVEDKSEDHWEDIRLAALKGLAVLEEQFERVEVSVSDSEDEDIDVPNFVLRPKDRYINRPLPYVIGSEEWHKTWHVGLEDSSSDSETEKVSDKFSESDSESELPIIQDRSQIKETSDTSSEFDFSQKTEPKINVPNSSGSDNSVSAPNSNPNFAEQLAAKLGHVITEFQEPEVNTRPINKDAPKSHYGDMFFDEPPPLDEPKGLFSGGGGVFDDDDDEPFPKKGGGLFDENDSDEEVVPKKKDLFFEDPPAVDKKKPVGGVSILGGGKLFQKEFLKRELSSDEEIQKNEEPEKKKVDLFGDDDLFAHAPMKIGDTLKKKMNLFDSEEEEEDKSELFKEEVKRKEETEVKIEEESTPKKVSLFDDDDLFRDDLFSTNTTKSFASGLFDDIPSEDLFSEKSNLFQEKPQSGNLFDDLVTIPDKNSINVDSTSTEEKKPFFSSSPKKGLIDTKPEPKPRQSLFDSPPLKSDDLFASNETSGLFDDTPPKIDIPSSLQDEPKFDLWDTNLDNVSEHEEVLDDFEEPIGKISLFSEEPPSLDFKPEKTKPIPGKLKHNLNINVGALAPGYVPPKRAASTSQPTSPELPKLENDPKVELPPPKAPEVPEKTSIDEPDNIQVLHSVTKDRARVPLNRRPSTRRGRKAALSTAPSDFELPQESNEIVEKENVDQKSENDGLFGSTEISGSLSAEDFFTNDGKKLELPISDSLFGTKPATTEMEKDDLFGPPDISENDLFEIPPKTEEKRLSNDSLFSLKKEEPSTSLSKGNDLFGPPQLDFFGSSLKTEKTGDLLKVENQETERLPIKKDLFESPSNTFTSLKTEEKSKDSLKTEVVKKSDKGGLFDDDDDDDGLFSKKPVQSTKTKKSLFDDDNDDDDDIFKNFSTAGVRKTETKVAKERKVPKVSSVKKLENTKPDDDPLSALLK